MTRTHRSNQAEGAVADSSEGPSPHALAAFVLLWLALGTLSLFGGPALGDHEVIVAQTARQTLETDDWIVLTYLDTPFLVKPPMPVWLVAAVSMVLPADRLTGLPVSAFTARLPSLLATGLTILLLLRLGRSMFGPRSGAIAAFCYATSVGALLFACNATAEALLTFFCTWSYAEFWWSLHETGPRRRWHLFRFYVALGLAMLAKGPMPLAVVAVPIALWWWCHRPGELLTRCGPRGLVRSARRLITDFLPRLRFALARLGLWWGVPIFLLMFLPWMILVAQRVPYAWDLWEYEYLDRFEGNYPGARFGNYFYYIPILVGLLLPWTLSVPEALLAPFIRRYRPASRPIAYAWYWVVGGTLVMSLMTFKKSYYILPAAPGLALLLAPVLDRLFIASRPHPRAGTAIRLALILAAMVAVGGWFVGRHLYPEEWNRRVAYGSLAVGLLLLGGFAWAGRLFLQQRRVHSLVCVGMTSLILFVAAWIVVGPSAANIDDPTHFVEQLQRAGIPEDAELYWAGNRPDGRVVFYGRRPLRQVVDPYKLIAEKRRHVTNRSELRRMVGDEILRLMEQSRPVYCVLEREDYYTLVQFLKLPAKIVFDVDRGKIGPDGDDWILCANMAALASNQ